MSSITWEGEGERGEGEERETKRGRGREERVEGKGEELGVKEKRRGERSKNSDNHLSFDTSWKGTPQQCRQGKHSMKGNRSKSSAIQTTHSQQ